MNRLIIIILSFVTALIFSSEVFGQDTKIDKAVQKFLPEIINLRHIIHQNPELGNREFNTAELVAKHLRKLGLEVTTGVAHTGVVGILKGGKDGPVVAVRADIDALPVIEDTDLPFKSTVITKYLGKEVGVMHACGHDVHTAVQLGVISVLASMKKDIPGTIKFIFQPAEEGVPIGEEGGAKMMVEKGVLQNPRPSAIFGLHTNAALDIGKIGYTIGPAYAAADRFIIKIIGKQAHGAAPSLSIDPIVTASQVVTALQTIRSRNQDPLEPSVITVGIFRGGERFNIIPAEVHLEGTVRTYNANLRDLIEKRMNEILNGITIAAGATYKLDYIRITPSAHNNPELSLATIPSLEKVVGKNNVINQKPTMGYEDFAEFANDVRGFYYSLGSSNPANPSGGHHTPTFRADDKSVEVGMRVMSNVLMDYLKNNNKEKINKN